MNLLTQRPPDMPYAEYKERLKVQNKYIAARKKGLVMTEGELVTKNYKRVMEKHYKPASNG